ncbi:uncharacterized protein LOC122457425 [Dermochelys coriacea]|uniref:uncharacterized protein LOC122457425 n=1 Tax=Dermochelys coriacea TaxID=27794 RepID=UPI001CA8A46E|nr:uncharacterized protein LOC122457425 [Dermochelys coriacea]
MTERGEGAGLMGAGPVSPPAERPAAPARGGTSETGAQSGRAGPLPPRSPARSMVPRTALASRLAAPGSESATGRASGLAHGAPRRPLSPAMDGAAPPSRSPGPLLALALALALSGARWAGAGDCKGQRQVLRGPEGFVSDGPGNYSVNGNCEWLIEAPSSRHHPCLHAEERNLDALDANHALACTKPFRRPTQLFMATAGGRKGLLASSQRISNWITSCIRTRYGQARVQLPPSDVGRVASWSSVHMFPVHYAVTQQARADAGRGRGVL